MSAHSIYSSHASRSPTWYQATARGDQTYPPLAGEHHVDVCIIGGGFSGINTALELAEKGLKVCLLEAHALGWGASGCNGGQLIRGIGHGLAQFLPYVGQDGVRALSLMGLEAVEIVRQRIEKYSIDCDLVWGYCDLANKPADFARFKVDMEELSKLSYQHEMRLVEPQNIHDVVGSNNYCGGLIDMGSGHLHALNLLLGEAQVAHQLGVQIFEQSPVQQIVKGSKIQLKTQKGVVVADQIAICCNAYLNGLEPYLDKRILPAGSYMIATAPLEAELAKQLIPQNMALCDQCIALDYYRLSSDNRLLFGGACHYSGRDPKDIAAHMRPKMLKVFPQLQDVAIEYQWGGMIGIGANRFPQIGRLAEQPNIFYAQAYAGHGLNTTHLAGRLLSEAIAGQSSRGFELCAKIPHRAFPGGRYLRSPMLALGMMWYRLKEALG